MKSSFKLLAFASALAAAACSGPGSPASPGSVAAATVQTGAPGAGGPQPTVTAVPFKGTIEGTQSVTPLTPPLMSVQGSANGTATLLGRYTAVFPHTVNVATRIGTGTYTFTAANGDTLTADFTGEAQGAPPLVSIVEHATITGGTGRFAGATGSFIVQREFNQSTGAVSGSFDGELSFARGGQP